MKTLNALFATLLLTGAGTAHAASSVDLTVRGLITPSACEPTLSGGGNVEIGKISAKDLNADTHTRLPDQTVQLSITCDAATLMAIEPKDNRAGSAFNPDNTNFGLGVVNGGEKLGAFQMYLQSPVGDGAELGPIISNDGGLTWVRYMYLTSTSITSVANATTIAPVPVQSLVTDVVIVPYIASASSLTLTEEVPIDGSATLTVKYL
jgi:type 1 fimbria pilin